jgi:hypothetical protein
MVDKVTLGSVGNIDNSLLSTINNNNALTTTAINNTLSRDGTIPNQMFANLDMNSFQILNLPAPGSINSPLRLADVAVFSQPVNIITALTGTSGHTVPFLDGVNTWSAPQTLALPSLGTGTGLTITETVSGTNTSGVNINNISIIDSLAAGPQFSIGLQVTQGFGTSSATGGRSAIDGQTNLLSPTSASNSNRNYVGVAGTVTAVTADNGTSPTSSGTSAGAFQAGSFLAAMGSSATSLFTVCGGTFNTQMAAGSSTWSKALAQFSSNPSDAVNGSGVNTMLWLFNQAGAVAKWTNAILIDNSGGIGSFPLSTSATIFKVGAGTVATGIDLSGVTFSSAAYLSPGFIVNQNGAIGTGGVGIANGLLQFTGTTSGSLQLSVDSTVSQLTITKPVLIGVIGTTAGTLTLAGQTSGSTSLSCSTTGSTLQLASGNLTISSGGNLVTNGTLSSGTIGTTGSLTLSGTTSGSVVITTPSVSAGLVQFGSAGSFSANGAVATALTSVGPVGSHTTVQTWLTIVDNGGVTRWIPCF